MKRDWFTEITEFVFFAVFFLPVLVLLICLFLLIKIFGRTADLFICCLKKAKLYRAEDVCPKCGEQSLEWISKYSPWDEWEMRFIDVTKKCYRCGFIEKETLYGD